MAWWDDPHIYRPPGSQLVKDSPDYVRSAAERKARRERGVAGSYNHIIDKKGDLLDNEKFVGMVENLGDAYETVEEMYGMIWWLAHNAPMIHGIYGKDPEDLVEAARQNYQEGLALAKNTPNKKNPDHDS